MRGPSRHARGYDPAAAIVCTPRSRSAECLGKVGVPLLVEHGYVCELFIVFRRVLASLADAAPSLPRTSSARERGAEIAHSQFGRSSSLVMVAMFRGDMRGALSSTQYKAAAKSRGRVVHYSSSAPFLLWANKDSGGPRLSHLPLPPAI